MKNIIYLGIIIVLLGIIVSLSIQLEDYQIYYLATEDFLDTLEMHYNWVDAFDPEDYYFAVDNLK